MSQTPRRALIVIDVQNEYFTGDLPIEYPDPAVSLANITAAMDAARRHGLALVVVQNIGPETAPVFARGSHGAALHEEVARRGHDLLVEKKLPSAFTDTGLLPWLVGRGIDTVTLAGYMTHNCDDATAKDATRYGFGVEFLQDASGSVPYENSAGAASAEEIHRVFSIVMQTRFANVMSTAQWLAGLEGAPLPQRDNIYSSNQRARQRR
ncbi:cysteine hydrolase family protein [Bordetella genomosp. 1]|uniref:Cysteine hydrolase n=1 Tax=Bordetella genomosp. 1 TaxID=1395607 RepID=A0ABX4F5K7_9BORD|nr:cysteine hydrolase family protein [Bordetella genomosp. 1]OZI69059.1 cysteine hydrolase [Bordetella genomosp. 1]